MYVHHLIFGILKDLKRRQDREVVSFNDNQEEGWGVNRLEPSVKISEYDQVKKSK